MKTDLMSLLKLIATNKMRTATPNDNPYFNGPDVYALDLEDGLLMVGQDGDGFSIFLLTVDGCVQYNLDGRFETTLNELED